MAKKHLTLLTALTISVLALSGCGTTEPVKVSTPLPELEQYTEQCPPPDIALASGARDFRRTVNAEVRKEIDTWLANSADFQRLKSVWIAKGYPLELKDDDYVTAMTNEGGSFVGVSHRVINENEQFTMVVLIKRLPVSLSSSATKMYLRENLFKGTHTTRAIWSESSQLKQCKTE